MLNNVRAGTEVILKEMGNVTLPRCVSGLFEASGNCSFDLLNSQNLQYPE